MYLKSIEVQGFKSFANKIKFDFHEGITGIVGPNGSGKSNVADAVRWVLGEQRVKQLRGGSMQDVIFSGTENRKPLSYASVAITLNNADHQLPVEYEEVTVARKLYRSGESEYLINGTVCRLKDINEMFYDTGIGKEGYSIIGQGQIDKILSGKPEERRELFDEAAGIVKFKRRKNISLKKLEEERQNLTRVKDILFELEKQVGPLKKQSESAREYLKKKEEMKVFDINMFLLETERIKKELAETEKKLAAATEEFTQAQKSCLEMKTGYEAVEEETDEVEYLIEKSKNQLSQTTLLKQQLEGQIEVLLERINAARMNDEHYDSRIKAVLGELEERQRQKEQFMQERKGIRERLADVRKEDDEAKKVLTEVQSRISLGVQEVEQCKHEIMELLNNRAFIRANIQHYTTTKEQIGVRRAELGRQLLELTAEGEQNNAQLALYEEELKKIKEEETSCMLRIQEAEKKIERYQTQLSQKQEELRIGQAAYHRESSRLESLKNITERYDGYGNSIRRVMAVREKEQGLLGVVADIIKVEKEYELAIETALGGSIQNIVTDTEETAKRMIKYLKENKYGRATFLPLTAMRSGGPFYPQEALRESGVIGAANTLVTVEPRYRVLADQLLGRTIVADHIEHGIAIARKYRQSFRIVTLEGDLLNPGGSMAGGAFKNAGNLLSRRREIEELEKAVIMLKGDMSRLEESVSEIKQKRAGCYHEIDEIQPLLRKVSIAKNTARINVEQIQEKLLELTRSRENVQKEYRELEGQLKDIRDKEESVQTELKASQILEQECNERIERLSFELEADRAGESAALKHSEDVHVSRAGLEQQDNFIIENMTRIDEEILRFEEEHRKLGEDRKDTAKEIRDMEQQIENLRNTIEESGEIFSKLQEEIQIQSARREDLNRKHKIFLQKQEELSSHRADLDKECFRLNSKKESFEEALDRQINYMWEEYELTYSHACQLRNEELTDLAHMKRRIQELRQEIKNLGDINVNAIEEYKTVSERYEFLKAQHEDLIEAEATLVQIVEELDTAMRRQFREQFLRISKEFDTVFRELFGGGKGTLELMEGEDVLEAGIRVIAQPPGKKLQNMMQLSGGEKALTAISLLFAIQNLKPSPFCLLDEIEAALDDSNVGRFAKYLHKLTEHTQFIVITHRRGTMTAADRLYGITMQEKGVSTLVSVDLLENDLEK